MPLLLRGARQTGKTYIVTEFADQHFKYIISINFELERKFLSCFDDLSASKITQQLSTITNIPIIPGSTLLFFDEIQECPAAISSLRYFKEQMPELHVIGAGSLLEFTLNDANFRMPVGRVQSLYLKPLSFKEYLMANNYLSLLDIIYNADLNKPIPDAIHQKLLDLLHEYFILGGMPAVVANHLEQQDLSQTQILQNSLLNTYRNDFGKYASKAQHKYLQAIFDKTPGMVGTHFQYVKVDPHMQSRDLRTAISALKDAGLIYTVYSTQATRLPLNALINEKKFKLLFLDIGLVKASSGLDSTLLINKNLMLVNQGMLVEQFVGQELLAHTSAHLSGQLFYWSRQAKSSLAEIDYVIHVDENIIPVEVKSGKTGRLKSLQIFLEEKKSPFGIRISQQPIAVNSKVLSIPLYMISEVQRLARQLNTKLSSP